MFFDNDEDDRGQGLMDRAPRWGQQPDPNAQPMQHGQHGRPDWGGIMQRLRQRFAGRFGQQGPQGPVTAPVSAPMGGAPAAPNAGIQDAARLFGDRRRQPGGIMGSGGMY